MTDISERRKSFTSAASPPIQQFATFKPKHTESATYTHIPTPLPTPADEYKDSYPQTISVPSTRGGPAPVRDVRAKRDRSVDIFEKHTLTKPRVDKDDEGNKFSFRTDAAAEFEKPEPLEKKTVKLMALPMGKRRSKSVASLMSAEDVVRANAKMNQKMELKERSRERGEAARMLMGNVKRSAEPAERDEKLDSMLKGMGGFKGMAERARERSRSSSRNRWEVPEIKPSGNARLAGHMRRRSLTIATGNSIEESEDEEEENPRTGRLGARF